MGLHTGHPEKAPTSDITDKGWLGAINLNYIPNNNNKNEDTPNAEGEGRPSKTSML